MTEMWNMKNGENEIIQPALPNGAYELGIALFPVDADFCKKN